MSGIQRVVFGAKEPGTFVKDSRSCKILDEAGVRVGVYSGAGERRFWKWRWRGTRGRGEKGGCWGRARRGERRGGDDEW